MTQDKFIEEHIAVYNAADPSEWLHIPLRLSFGNLPSFVASTYGRSTATFNTLEEQVLLLIRDTRSVPISSLSNGPLVLAPLLQDEYSHISIVSTSEATLYMRYVYIVNELIYFSFREYAGETHRQLALLLFKYSFFNFILFYLRKPILMVPLSKKVHSVQPALCHRGRTGGYHRIYCHSSPLSGCLGKL